MPQTPAPRRRAAAPARRAMRRRGRPGPHGGGARHGAGHRWQGPGQPHGAVHVGRAHAAAPGPARPCREYPKRCAGHHRRRAPHLLWLQHHAGQQCLLASCLSSSPVPPSEVEGLCRASTGQGTWEATPPAQTSQRPSSTGLTELLSRRPPHAVQSCSPGSACRGACQLPSSAEPAQRCQS